MSETKINSINKLIKEKQEYTDWANSEIERTELEIDLLGEYLDLINKPEESWNRADNSSLWGQELDESFDEDEIDFLDYQ